MFCAIFLLIDNAILSGHCTYRAPNDTQIGAIALIYGLQYRLHFHTYPLAFMIKLLNFHSLAITIIGLALLAGCGTNPVTGERELSLVSEAQEIKIGEQNYLPSQQSQGGPYVADPRLTAYVKRIGMKLAKVSDRPDLPFDFVVLNNPVPNAWALPGGKIAVNSGLLTELNNEAELAAVLGHEIVHAAARHGAKSMERGLLLQTGVSTLGVAVGGQENANIIVGAASLGTALITQKYSRDAESEADLYGMRYMAKAGYDPQAAVTLQETFVKLAQGKESNWLDGLFASHPPSPERVEANKKAAAKLNAKGALKAKEYQAMIAHLVKTKPAYDKYQAGQEALSDKNHSKALKLAEEAIAIEPNEGLFYGLKGDALYSADKFSEAENAYGTALKKNPDFFYFYLRRGLVREQLKHPAAAQQDLEQSAKLLPTAVAYYKLGNMALQQKDENKAREYYKRAAGSKSLAGQHAAIALAKLELPKHPEQYIEVKPQLSRNGSVGLVLINHAPVTVGNIRLEVAIVTNANTIIQTKSLAVRDVIAAGSQLSLDSKLYLPRHGDANNVRTRITYASAVTE
jgi:predicted Zn-dependent protease